MPAEVTFVDLGALAKIKPDTVVEKFGGIINSSFFDASTILATLKQKGLVDFTTAFPGTSAITITDLGKKLLADAAQAATTEFDQLDLTLLTQLAAGKRNITDLGGAVNVSSSALAMHIYKLSEQGYLAYEFRNGTVTVTLTEKGFMQSKNGMPMPSGVQPQGAATQQMGGQPAQSAQKPAMAVQKGVQAKQQAAQQAAPGTEAQVDHTLDIKTLEANIKKARRQRIIAVIVIIIIVVILLVAFMEKLLPT